MDPDGRETAEDLPSIKCLEYSKVEKYESSREELIGNLEKMISSLETYNTSSSSFNMIKKSSEKWLKNIITTKDDSTKLADKLKLFRNSLKALKTDLVKYDEKTSYEAYVEVKGRRLYGVPGSSGKTLVLGYSFFSSSSNKIEREGTLIHEMSHYCLDTVDNDYGAEKCLNFNSTNADNWSLFYGEIFNGKRN